jgi:uncharacterized membrane protein
VNYLAELFRSAGRLLPVRSRCIWFTFGAAIACFCLFIPFLTQSQAFSVAEYRKCLIFQFLIALLWGGFVGLRVTDRFGPFIIRLIIRDRFLKTTGIVLTLFIPLAILLTPPPTAANILLLLLFSSSVFFISLLARLTVISQAPALISALGKSLDESTDRLYPHPLSSTVHPIPFPSPKPNPSHRERRVCALKSGYIHSISKKELVILAQSQDTVFTLHCRQGDYLVQGEPLATVSSDDALTPLLAAKIRDHISMSDDPECSGDILFQFRMLSSLVVRLFDSGIGDLPTAHMGIHRLSSSLAGLAKRTFPAPFYYDHENRLRLIAPQLQFNEIIDAVYNSLRSVQTETPYLYSLLLESLGAIAESAHRFRDRETLLRHAILVERISLNHSIDDYERSEIIHQFQEVMRILFPNRSVTLETAAPSLRNSFEVDLNSAQNY